MTKKPFLIVLDCETGGLNEKENPITEIALSVLSSIDFKEVFKYQTYIQCYSNLSYDPIAIKATQVDMYKIASGKTFDKVVKELIEIFNEYNTGGKANIQPILIGHNIKFDLKFLRELFKYAKKDFSDYIEPVLIDTMQLMQIRDANWKMKDGELSRVTLSACCERMGIKLTSAHGAAADVNATIKLATLLLKSMREESKNIEKISSQEHAEKSRKFFEF